MMEIVRVVRAEKRLGEMRYRMSQEIPTAESVVASKCKAIAREIKEMPPDPSRMASVLVKLGVKGIKKDGRRCVLAAYFMKKYGLEAVQVTGTHVAIGDGVDTCYIRMTEQANNFIEHFDCGCYPDLDIEAEEESNRQIGK